MSDGMLSIKSRPIKQQEIAHEKTKQRELRGGTYRYFVRGRDSQAAKVFFFFQKAIFSF